MSAAGLTLILILDASGSMWAPVSIQSTDFVLEQTPVEGAERHHGLDVPAIAAAPVVVGDQQASFDLTPWAGRNTQIRFRVTVAESP